MTEDARCDRFAQGGALAIERGTLDDDHLASCADCRAAHDAYLRFAGAIRQARPDVQPPPGWDDGVRSRIAGRRRARRRRWITGAAAAGLAAAVVIGLIVWSPDQPAPERRPSTVALRTSIGSNPRDTVPVMRSDSARPLDVVSLDAIVHAGVPGELRVYRIGHDLILRCAPDDPTGAAAPPGCQRSGTHLVASVVLPTAGRYRAVLFSGAWHESAAHATGSLDQDVAFAQGAGLEVVLDDPIDVR